MIKIVIIHVVFVALISGCTSANRHKDNVGIGGDADKLTVGKVQKEIRLGMSGAEVATVLGSPNIVTTDGERREVWIYDKVATEMVTSSSSSWVFVLLAGGQSHSGASSTTQRTLTIVVKFDKNNRVRDFAYHTSKF